MESMCDWKSLLEILEVKSLKHSTQERDPSALQAILAENPRDHYWSQVERLARGQKRDDRFRLLGPLLRGWRRRFLPAAYGIWVDFGDSRRVDGFYFQIRGHKLEGYYRPSLAQGRTLDGLLRSLAERHMVPVHCLEISRADWAKAVAAEKPWRELARAVRKGRASTRSAPLKLLYLSVGLWPSMPSVTARTRISRAED